MAPPPSTRVNNKNIWVAASDGDLDRVRYWIEDQGLSPNVKDENSYSPMHAAASYGHCSLLDYLVSQGGDVNLTDDDGDTPIYTVENIETARWLIEHGASISHTNLEGHTAVDTLAEEFPDVAVFLGTLSGNPVLANVSNQPAEPSEYITSRTSEALTTNLLSSVDEIMTRAQAEGRDPDVELRELVERTVLQSMQVGTDWVEQNEPSVGELRQTEEHSPNKRRRQDQGDGGPQNGI